MRITDKMSYFNKQWLHYNFVLNIHHMNMCDSYEAKYFCGDFIFICRFC